MDTPIQGTNKEIDLFTEVNFHYVMAKQDLEQRLPDFDKKDVLFRSHLDEKNWPYRALIFDPRTFTTLYEKTARILANKPKGRMIPREGGDALGAKINNELLSFQWDDNERVDSMPMIAKWSLMDLNTRKYGAAFGLCKWHYQKDNGKVFFDGPNFKPLYNRDCLPNPSYSTIKNWFQHRDYVTLQDLEAVNDAARTKPIYKNLDLLRLVLKKDSKEGGGDTRQTNYNIKNLSIKGLQDFLGRDPSFKTVEIITEYRNDRWITFAPKHGLILRDIENPYKHGQIPVVCLKYYIIDDDIYGLSEIEPIEKIQRALNALLSQYYDAINMSLYAPIKVRSTGGAVQMHTLEFGPGKKWMMSDPATDVLTHDQSITGVSEFTSTYRVLVGALQEAMGDTSAGVSNAVPGGSTKTATEIKDTAISRSARDNFNQIYLGEALKKQMMFWHQMNQQFLFSNPNERQKVLRIVGKDAIKYFQNMGLDATALTDDAINLLSSPEMQGVDVNPQEIAQPLYPVKVGQDTISKLTMENDGQGGALILEPEDLSGNYDYIPDVGSMTLGSADEQVQAKAEAIQFLSGINPKTGQPTGIAMMVQQEGKKIKATELLIDYLEDIGFKNADQYFENAPQQGGLSGQVDPTTGLPIPTGAGSPQTSQTGMPNGGAQGMAGNMPQGINI